MKAGIYRVWTDLLKVVLLVSLLVYPPYAFAQASPSISDDAVELVIDEVKYKAWQEEGGGAYVASVIGTTTNFTNPTLVIPSEIINEETTYTVASIADRAFNRNKTIQEVVLPESIIEIGDYAFSECANLHNIQLSSHLLSIGEWAFSWCESLTDIDFPSTLNMIHGNAFLSCTGLTKVDLKNTQVETLPNFSFWNCTSLKSVQLPDGIKILGNYLFGEAIYGSQLGAIYIPKTVETIGSYAFSACINLTTITVDELNPYFYANGGMLFNKEQTVLLACPGARGETTVPDGVIEIGTGAFSEPAAGHKSFSVVFPSSVSIIGYDAFGFCNLLKSITCWAQNPPEVKGTGTINLTDEVDQPIYFDIFVPANSLERYKNADKWKDRASYIFPIDDTAIETVETPSEEYADIYTLTGVLMHKKVKTSELNLLLPPGLYIRVSPSATSKILIR